MLAHVKSFSSSRTRRRSYYAAFHEIKSHRSTLTPPWPMGPYRHKHKLAFTKRTKYALHTSLDSGSLFPWRAWSSKTLDELHQPNQIIDAKPRLAPSDDFKKLRTTNVRPACGYRPQASFFIVEIHPVSSPVLAVLEDFELSPVPRMERVRDSTPPYRPCRAGCSRFMFPTPDESSLAISDEELAVGRSSGVSRRLSRGCEKCPPYR